MSSNDRTADEIYDDRRLDLITRRGGLELGDFVNLGVLTLLRLPDFSSLKMLPVEHPILCEFCPQAIWVSGLWFAEATCGRLHKLVYTASYEALDAQSNATRSYGAPFNRFGILTCSAYEEGARGSEADLGGDLTD